MELKIKLKVKDVEIELTEDEALELKDLLDKLCTQKTEYMPYYRYFPTWTWPLEWWQQPYIYTNADNTIVYDDWHTISNDIQVSYSYS